MTTDNKETPRARVDRLLRELRDAMRGTNMRGAWIEKTIRLLIDDDSDARLSEGSLARLREFLGPRYTVIEVAEDPEGKTDAP